MRMREQRGDRLIDPLLVGAEGLGANFERRARCVAVIAPGIARCSRAAVHVPRRVVVA